MRTTLGVLLRSLLRALIALGLASSGLFAAAKNEDAHASPGTPPSGTAPPATEYVVFVGLDPTVRHEAEACPIVDAGPESVAVVAHGRRVSLPTRNLGIVDTKPEPKISAGQVELADVRTRPGYTGSNPAADRDRQQLLLSILADERQTQAINEWKEADSNVRLAEAAVRSGLSGPEVVDAAMAQQTAATAGLDNTIADGMRHTTSDVGTHLSPDQYNALHYSARISAPREIENAYGMLRLVVTDPANPRVHVCTIRFLPLPRLGPEPHDVRVAVGGLPAGFAVEDCRLHVFVAGRELATSNSPNRLTVSPDEAHQFLVLRYLANQKKSTIPPAIIPELLPPDLAAHVGGQERSLAIDFAIDRDGKVTGLTLPPGAGDLSRELLTMLRSLRFYPALVNGTPMDSSGTFALSEFIR